MKTLYTINCGNWVLVFIELGRYKVYTLHVVFTTNEYMCICICVRLMNICAFAYVCAFVVNHVLKSLSNTWDIYSAVSIKQHVFLTLAAILKHMPKK